MLMISLDKELAIILPTYNESSNLRTLMTKIFKVASGVLIIIVDDSKEIENIKIKNIAKIYKNVEVLTRERKLGRGSAVLYGFTHALKNKNIKYFVEMDTDLAHDPAELHLLQTALKMNKAQLAIGSRYNRESRIVKWPMRRLIMSRLINLFLDIWLGLHLDDYTNGYRMYTRKAIEYVVRKGLHEKNFIALSESAYIIKKKGFDIVEVPITFTDRKHGESTVGITELLICLIGAIRIRLRDVFQADIRKR